MQQPMSQQEQMCQQQIQQQMVLCPVRFVYETQILVPPGDQIQPNQTFFINPQNPPPWAHNRQIQNQVVYVQQLPNNMLPSSQQHMEQNQLYLHQNFGNYQIQPIMAQNQEIRTLSNMVPNMVQNERNIGQSLPNPNQIQANAQMIQNQMNLHRQLPSQGNQTLEAQRHYMRPQMTQQTITRPMMAMNPIQNTSLQQNFTNMPNVVQQVNYGQMFAPNANQPRPVTQNIQRNVQPGNIPTMVSVQPVTKVRDTTPVDANKVMHNIANGVPIANINPAANGRNFLPNYAYRPIQPRPQVRHSSTQIQIKPVQNSPMYIAKSNPQTVTTNLYMGSIDNNVNRKRKSESPDEIQKKIAIAKPNYNAVTQSITVTKLSNEIGVNTSPVHRINNKTILNTNTVLQVNSNNAQILKIVDNVQKLDETVANTANITNTSVQTSEKDKLVRNTVFTQARGRLLHDKNATSHDMTSQTSEIDFKPDNASVEVKVTDKEIHSNVTTETTTTITHENKPEINKKEKLDEPVVTNDKSNVVKEEKDAINDLGKVKDENIDDNDKIVLKKDRDSILTHVLDGYVIQESCFAFPIRKPLKEKTLVTNAQEDGQTNKDIKEEKPPIDLPLLPFHYLHLHNDRLADTSEVTDEKDDKDNPFSKLQYATVKTWTVEELTKHLSKYAWKETVSLFQDHEIDGESLFLVSKSQLLTIGVNENHADLICEFVKS